MYILDATTKSLEILLGGAITTNEMVWTVHYVEILLSDMTLADIKENHGLTTGATAVTMVAAPASGKVRQVKAITVYNKDTVAQIMEVRVNDGGTFRTVFRLNTQTSEDMAIYEEGDGWKVMSKGGSIHSA